MNENVDIDAREVAALEERLYSQCHHSYEVTTSSEGMSLPMADNVPSRIVSKTSVVNNPQSAQLKSKMKRYWATTEGYSASPKPFLQPSNTYQKQSAPSELTRTNGNGSSVVQSNANEVKKMYTMPYQSLLGNSAKNLKDNRPTLPAETVAKVTNESCNLRKAQGSAKPNPPRKLKKNFQPKKNHQPSQHAVQKKLGGLMKLVNSDTSESRRQRFQGKKAKAIEVRKFNAPRVVAQVFLDSSDDESKPTVVMPQTKVNIDAQSDGETDEVVIVPLPEPPKICIDCSDDEVALDSFALPQAKKASKKATVAKFNSPRCLSPSNSSIMSDDFIGLHDRSRLNDSFSENVPNDDELECSIEGKRGGDVQEGTKSSLPSRDLRAPSISSEETICTSSDTTDQDKHRQESGKGSKSKSLPTSRNEIVAAGENGKKNELSNKKGSSQATVTKQLLDRAPPETITERSISSTPSGTVKKGSTKKATPSMQASEPIASNSSAKSKSPISMALELARKHFEGNDSFETATGSAKKKSKKGRASDANQLSITQDLIPPKRVAKKSAKARKKVGTDDSMYELLGESTAEERADRLPLSDDSVSSESDYELTLAAPQGTGEQTISTSLANETASKQPSVAALPAIEGLENISSESEYEESFSQALKSTPKTAKALSSAKRVGRKRKQYNSETFSDEDFACMLTDIVRAVSDTDSDEEEEVEDGQERQEKESNHATEVPDDAVTSTTVIAELDCGEQEKQTKVGEPSAKKKKRSADASKTVSASIVGASKPNGNGKTMEKCSNAASSTTASAEHECETQGKQTKAGGSSTTKKKKRSFDASNAASSSIVEVGGNQGDEGDNIVKQTVAATSTTAVDVAERADGPSTKKKRRSNDISNASIASIVDRNEDVCSEQLDSDANQMAAPTTRSQIVQELPDCAWNEEMKQFYNEVWMEEDFTLSSVMQKMPRGKKHWPILQQDLYPDPPKKDVICNNCGDRGHMRYKCKNTPKPAICYMCGEQGHREPRCPRSMCLNCGARTRNFVRGCNACARDLNTTCRLCGVRGHVQRSCPDMWRRYHSTTEDNVALRNQFQTNMKPKYCCICCKSGHQAHICNAAYRIFGQAVPTVHIKSYQQTYAVKQQDNKESTTVPRYNLFSDDANECELNLHGLASNPNGFYYRFAKSSGLLEKHEQRLNQEEEAKQQWLQQLQQNQQEQQQPEQEKEVDKYENRPQNVAGSSRQENNDPVAGSVPAVETEDSNYSFSGLLAEKEHVDHESVIEAANEASPAKDNEAGSQVKSVAKAPESWPDFIPLGAEPEAPLSPEQLPPKDNVVDTSNVMEAKVPLTEAQAKMLLSSRGSNFLKEAAKRHSLKLSISFEMVGNVLLLSGRADSQDCFHKELLFFLRSLEPKSHNQTLLNFIIIPRRMRRAFQLIFENLWRLKEPQEDVHVLLENYQTALQSGKEKQIKRTRTSLNLVLFGQFGLRDGRKHLKTLRNQLLEAMKYNHIKDELKLHQRITIRDAFIYIFSSYDHVDYCQVVSEYEEMCSNNLLHKFTWSDLRLPEFKQDSRQMKFLRVIKKGLYRNFVDSQLIWNTSSIYGVVNKSEEMSFKEEHNPSPTMPRKRKCIENRKSDSNDQQEDIVLNTRDQMLKPDPDTASRDYHDQQTIRAMTFPCGVLKSEHKRAKSRNNQFNHLINLFNECRRLAENVHPDMRDNAISLMNEQENVARSISKKRVSILIHQAHSLRTMLRKNQQPSL